jgi:hypothetical protein
MLAVNANLLGSAQLWEQFQPDLRRREAELPEFLAEPSSGWRLLSGPRRDNHDDNLGGG